MALDNLYIKTQKSIGSEEAGISINLDAVLLENHNSTVSVTTQPVEIGFKFSDHAVIESKDLTLIVSVSDTPLGLAALGQIVDLATGFFGTSTAGNETRSSAAYNSLIALQESRVRLTIETNLKTYTNMLIANVKTTQDSETSRVVDIRIRLKEYLISQTEVGKIEVADDTEIQVDPTQDRGRQEPSIPDDTTNRSVIQTVKKWVLGE